MTATAHPLGAAGSLALVLTLCMRLFRATKYEDAPRVAAPTVEDDLGCVLAAALLGVLCTYSFWLGLLASGVSTAFLLILWLDVALYHCFTFELGLGGISDVVLSNLVAEVRKMQRARQFFRTHRAFAMTPLLFLQAPLLLLLTPTSALRPLLELSLLASLLPVLVACWRSPSQKPSERSDHRHALWYDFLLPRRPRIPKDFQVRPEHAHLLQDPPTAPEKSPFYGVLRGRSVILLTFESVGSRHLGEEAAHTPFFSALRQSPQTICSQHHVSVAPLTNVAHRALYFGRHSLRERSGCPSYLASLEQAGYRRIYLTAVNTAHYGLSTLLQQAGFDHICDGKALLQTEHSATLRSATDSILPCIGVAKLSGLLAAQPFFLHVHAANAHLPYLVEDPQRFHRHDQKDDRGRFLNAVEETDAMFSRLYAALCAELSPKFEGPDRPLLLVSSDHGQSFGEHGYHSHGSAVTAEQTEVPLLIHHPLLSATTIPWSTHFEVLPTVLDLLGMTAPGTGAGSMLQQRTKPSLLLWDGQPSRPTSGCLGLLIGNTKYCVDLVRDTLIESDWNDRPQRILVGAERHYFEALIGLIAKHQGVL